MTNYRQPFTIMPKMQFSEKPKLLHAAPSQITLDKGMRFENFLGDGRYRDGGHGDAFARVREKFIPKT